MSAFHVRLGAMGALLAIGAFTACSTGEVEPSASDVHEDGGVDAEAASDADGADAGDLDASDSGDAANDANDAAIPRCTVDWCETPLPIPDGGTLKLMDVWVPGKNDAWAVSEEGHVLRWNGAAWSIVWTAGMALYGVWGDHEGAVWVVGAGGAIFRGPGGSGWAPIPSGVTSDLVGICEGTRDGEHPRNIAIVGSQSVLRWTGETARDGAPVWSTSSFDPMEELYAISCNGLDIWVAGADNDWFDSGGRIYVNGGAGWERIEAASGSQSYESYDMFAAVWAHDRQNVWTRGSFGIVHSAPATGGDVSWSRVDSYARLTAGDKRPSAIWGAAANDVWIVSTRGRIHHWDGSAVAITATAKTWDVMPSNLHAVSGSGADDVWVVGDNVALHRNVKKVGQ